MRKFLISATLLSAFAIATPASAQYYGGQGYGGQGYGRGGQGIERQLDRIAQRIYRLRDTRQIDRREAYRLERQAEQIDRLYDRYRRGGLNQWEQRDLQQRIQNLRGQIRWERNDRW